MRRLLVLIPLALCLTACSLATESSPESEGSQATLPVGTICLTSDGGSARDRLFELSSDWELAMTLADLAAPEDLEPRINRLRTIQESVYGQTWPECASEAERYFTGFMDQVILGLGAYQANKPEQVYRDHYRAAGELQDRFFEELFKLS